jgi:hypothetical protein
MSAQPHIIDLPLTLHLSEQARAKLVQRAAAAHTDVAAYVSGLVEQTTQAPQSFDAICGDAQQKFDQTGMTDEELSDLLEKEKHAARNERRTRRGS